MNRARISDVICGAVLLGILVAGLTPFQRPPNAVTWLGNVNGVHFGRYGTILSSGIFQVAPPQDEALCSLEIWLQPDLTSGSNTLLAFYTAENPLQLTLHLYSANLLLNRRIPDDQNRNETIGIENVFRQIEPMFVTITSGAQKTSMYVDGSLAQAFPGFRFGKECTGELVIGTSPIATDGWSGQLRGLAIYQKELTPAEVLQHYRTWTSQARPELLGNEHAIAVYLFNERAGSVVHNALRPGIDLNIPKRFSLLHQVLLEPFWEEFKTGGNYWAGVLNIGGFVPLGLFFCAHWSSVRPIKHAALTTVVLGLAVSLTIEILQSYLPTRSSGTTDLITNTLGTLIGVKLYASKAGRVLLAKVYRE